MLKYKIILIKCMGDIAKRMKRVPKALFFYCGNGSGFFMPLFNIENR